MRDKWLEVHFSNGDTDGTATIAKASASCREVYTPHTTAAHDDPPMPEVSDDWQLTASPDTVTATQPATVTSGAQPGNKRRYTLHNAAEALKPQPPIEWVIDRTVECRRVVNPVW